MKVIKRDGRIVDYDKSKIMTAIEKANNEVIDKEKATKEDIKIITKYIEALSKKRILVEDIQDIIEQKLMEIGKYELAKKYIVYRYTRALVRKSNTTDASILGLLRNSNKDIAGNSTSKNAIMASTQRNLIAGEVSKDLTKRILLPEKIVKAWESGALYFHNADYFIHPIINCSLINIKDMLDNGTVINEKMIDSPGSFLVACTIVTQIIAGVASNQYGAQTLNLSYLGKFLRKSKEKFEKEIKEASEDNIKNEIFDNLVNRRLKEELCAGVQTLLYQINTLMTTNGKTPLIAFFLHLELNDEYIEENALIIAEILKQRVEGIKNENGEYVMPEFPKLVYNVEEFKELQGTKYEYILNLSREYCLKIANNNSDIESIDNKENKNDKRKIDLCKENENVKFIYPLKDKNGIYSDEPKFSQGIVSINLPQIAIISDGDEEQFWKLLDERLELCKETLMCRHYALLGTVSDISPIHWQHGAIARLKKGEKIDKFLYCGYSTISLGYVGICEMTKLMKGVSNAEKEGATFATKVIQYMKNKLNDWKKETNIDFVLDDSPEKLICYKFAEIDRENFGVIDGATDKDYYSCSFDENDYDFI